MKVLFVCLGNICRSPLAEAIFNWKINQQGRAGSFQVDSCGTGNYNLGDAPDPRTVHVAFKNKVPIEHIARQLTQKDLHEFDLILVMDNHNLRHILHLCQPHQISKVKLMRSYDPQGEGEVPDPYYGREKDFDEVFEILHRSINQLVEELIQS